MAKPVLLTGIKPTGDLHIGNYFGALKPAIDLFMTGKYNAYLFLADYHTLNFIQDAEEMRRLSRECILAYLAAGLDPARAVVFKQSEVTAHTELCWIFDTITTMPYLERAHAYKDAEAKGREVSVGTFNYPMLMAADILLYDANVVPVGADQKQHVEYARDTAEKFNRVFKEEVFTLPEPIIQEEVAVVPGTDGRKMSKSYGNTIPLFASRDEIAKAVMSITTDSKGDKPEHVFAIHRLVRPEGELMALYEEKRGKYKELKEALIEDLDAYFAPIRAKYDELKGDDTLIADVLAKGGERARAVANAKMERVRAAIGVA
ncbi:MAG: tryptophan--tRNA ligase [Patescibacteria group bacterium]|nr:tryptophan--tRNA ligase [Patescibacteria group bacterium]MDE1943954.1 tryptophan--tRNA ligase [Patescibacteria group bacterium]MDE1945013.1 tryptophan--tRNA ligase [Patescibacteria group bacterium]MDE2057519.1 tryptophan--tRNA ligase [Patescibacteria group bacterium]